MVSFPSTQEGIEDSLHENHTITCLSQYKAHYHESVVSCSSQKMEKLLSLLVQSSPWKDILTHIHTYFLYLYSPSNCQPYDDSIW